ncbi:DUF2062 domain-containing protein [Halalkalicoccus jeotgali]|uniref:Uncharacterized protein n=1 Tax=Halalkalicoccus jeotgali (strain DSM 18796 / CECT 7217 / JCM 14584 / KCTC 4019 / B3) TaxID=795797 RepID=D8J884_HALJB|nr:DUF2062 domain-containing protein [Halalkalicoccus jeotgali]ADJ14197.1 hypothetical protein HacjB3_04030 [Halalkalicoccus jeotgali B3]ELY34621.1 hypothetical protein C497_15263 [Halalkalicoccus jeotgali B3]
MLRERLSEYRRGVRSELEAISTEDHPPRDIAASFALGVFITALPTLGAGLLVFVLIVALLERVSKLALFASVGSSTPSRSGASTPRVSRWERSCSGRSRA